MGSSIKQDKAVKEKIKGEFLRVLLIIMVLFVGGVGLHMSLLINQRFGPERTTDKRLFVREMLLESIIEKECDRGEM